jgi:hypothetical protein
MAQKRFLKILGERINKPVGSDTRSIIIPTDQTTYTLDKATIRKRALIFFSMLGFGSLFQYGYGWALHYFGGYSFPYTSPLFLPEDRFMDFFNPAWYAINKTRSNYAPFSQLLSNCIAHFIDFSNGQYEARHTIGGVLSLGAMVALFWGSIGLLAWKVLEQVTDKEGVAARITIFLLIFISMAVSYPVIFTIDRGNYAAMTFVVLSLAVLFLRRPLLSAVLLGTALSLKFYLGLLLFPFCQSRRYRFLLYTLAVIVIENTIPFLFCLLFDPSKANLFSLLPTFGAYSVWSLPQKMAWSSHLLNLFYAPIYPIQFFLGVDSARAAIPVIEKIYMFSIFLPGVLFGPWLISNAVKDLEGRLFYVTVLTILIAPNIGNYSLPYLLIFVPYLLASVDKTYGNVSIILLALCLMPKNYLTLLVIGSQRVTMQSFINPVLLLALMAVPFQSPKSSLRLEMYRLPIT